ncbi:MULTISPECIES: dTDP-4-dehydrorhamnose 3,5-epimerase [unclassified Sinorhizobium]|uniref:dTDP-4-dehydrorhamnose 3,5-epimerase n=1 Tax=unclassified Sinorhizobium TaxID=2613772 RepID=UPI0024C358D7|nr:MULTISPECIES: dTDP-4-dehydrorhamnose 3,5-epimerase [unclassified Sinorhizobium]MDK1373993.1 dTDP-4-dehydrorhamnose 3,5-epimerase [Sinorhizobium sp. 6-70]MDK1477406.1 dTDP-4-dehydrorhamnose 3,5-epimerase [Sinorhizobium sp. 6-117]
MSLEVRPLDLAGVLEILPRRIGDERGFFSETWSARQFAEHGVALHFVQDNHSYSASRGVLRGLHYQLPPYAQDKLVRVVKGAVFDVAVDIRRGSPSFAKWVAIEISARKWNQLLVPKGFAHGFLTLEPDTEVIYKVTNPYSPAHDRAIRFDDPDIAIAWPLPVAQLQLSEKDRAAPQLRQADVFDFVGGEECP